VRLYDDEVDDDGIKVVISGVKRKELSEHTNFRARPDKSTI